MGDADEMPGKKPRQSFLQRAANVFKQSDADKARKRARQERRDEETNQKWEEERAAKRKSMSTEEKSRDRRRRATQRRMNPAYLQQRAADLKSKLRV